MTRVEEMGFVVGVIGSFGTHKWTSSKLKKEKTTSLCILKRAVTPEQGSVPGISREVARIWEFVTGLDNSRSRRQDVPCEDLGRRLKRDVLIRDEHEARRGELMSWLASCEANWTLQLGEANWPTSQRPQQPEMAGQRVS
jgi:hypothetical protein